MPSHIAYLLGEYPHIRHAYLLREIRGLRRLGWDVATIAIRAEERASGVYTEEERDERARCFYILPAGPARVLADHAATLFRHPAGYARALARAFRIRRGILYFAEAVIAARRLERAGIAHVHTHYASNVAWLLAAIAPVEISMSIHGSGEFDEPRAFHLTEKIAASAFVRAIGYFGRSQLMRACPSTQWRKLVICRLGVDLPPAPERPLRAAGAAFRLLCVGGMATPRAFQLLVSALAAAQEPAISLTLVGDGPDRPSLERLARDLGVASRVHFTGWKTQDELRAIYAEAGAFVFSSFAEGIPVALMEAMAMGLPCVAPWIAGIPELIRDGVDGVLTAPGDERGMTEAMLRLYRDPELCRAMGEAARARVAELYNLERNIAELSELFEERVTTRPA